MTDRQYDIVVFGATSFVGQILARYLLEQFGTAGELRWAMAGRSKSKLEKVRQELGSAAEELPLIVADAGDETALKAMCEQARVVVSTVGPYALYGEPLVKSCAATGTDYCDLTGEAHWIRRMIDRYEGLARANGARIVHCCGFDSIPFDLGVYYLQQEALKRFGQPLPHVKSRVKAMRGGASGGTIASGLNIAKEAGSNPALRREMANPYSLLVDLETPAQRQPSLNKIGFDTDFNAWQAPFVMAAINTRIVHRSNALSGFSYGRDFQYEEAVLTGRGAGGRLRAYLIAGGLWGFMIGAAMRPTRWLLGRFLPKPGEGPSPEAQVKGFFDIRIFGRLADGRTLRAKVTGDADPGYGSTAKMLGQAAACLAQDVSKADKPGGFWTTATILDGPLIERLRAHSGMNFEIIE